MICPYLKSCLFSHYFWNFSAAAFWESDSKQKFPIPGNRVETVFIYCKMLWNKILKKSLLLFLFHGTGFRVVFSSAKWFGIEFLEFASIIVPWNIIPSIFIFPGMIYVERNSKSFLFRGTAAIPSEQTICFVYSV